MQRAAFELVAQLPAAVLASIMAPEGEWQLMHALILSQSFAGDAACAACRAAERRRMHHCNLLHDRLQCCAVPREDV